MRLCAEESVSLLSEIIRISNSTLDIDKRLGEILAELRSAFRLNSAALYVLDMEHGGLFLKASSGGAFKSSFRLGEGPLKALVKENRYSIFDKTSEESSFFRELTGENYDIAGGIFPVMDDRFFYGALALTLPSGKTFDEKELALIRPITQEIAGTMRNAQLYANTREMVDDLLMMNDLWKALSSTIKLDALLETAVTKTAAALHASSGMIEISECLKGDPCRCYYSEEQPLKEALSAFGDSLSSKLKTAEEAMFLTDLLGEEAAKNELLKSTIVAPLKTPKGLMGWIILPGKEDGKPFGNREIRLFSTISAQISAVVNNALLLEKMEELNLEKEVMVKELFSLFELNKAVMTTIDLDRLLHIILTAVTIGDGFGFNRAMLFLYNKKSGFIQGMIGVGPDSAEEAWRIWTDIDGTHKTLQAIVDDEDYDTLPHSKLNELVKGMRISDREKSILGLTVREKKAFNITDAESDPRVSSGLLARLGCKAFATSPLMASGRVVGVILVDNVYNERSISDEDIRLLTIFSNQAGVAIDNSVLYRNLQEAHQELKETQGKLIHTEKLAALGEMAAGVAHEIRNPLVSIGGFARRLSRKIEEGEDRQYIDIICKETERLENILNEILIFSREEPIEAEEQDINSIIEETLQFFLGDFGKSGIEIVKELEKEMRGVQANYHQIKQVFINLFANAKHAMPEGGTLKVRSFGVSEEDEERIVVEISDTGVGIPYNVMINMFNPFFTTKDDGTGLGLAITHKILSHYRGEIEVINNESGGATFIIKIPMSKKAAN